MYQLCDILKSIKTPPRRLNTERFADIHESQHIAKRELEITEEQLQRDPTYMSLQEKEKEYRVRYIKILKSSLSLIKYKASSNG